MTDQELLSLCNERFNYNPETGVFTWKKHLRGAEVGGKVGCSGKHEYNRISLNGKSYRSSRIAFLMYYGYLPEVVDHINRDKKDDRICNLRGCTQMQNTYNSGPSKNSESKYKGVKIKKDRIKKYEAGIRYNGKNKYLGCFYTEEEAARVWNTAARMYHGHEFCYTNIIE